MAEIGGSPTDCSAANLESTGNSPSTSNEPPKQAATKRRSVVEKDPTCAKKKRTAEELASTTKGRNMALKKQLREEKRQEKLREKKLEKKDISIEELLENRNSLLDRLQELEEREMEDNDKKEERLVEKERKMRDALLTVEARLKDRGALDDDGQSQQPNKLLDIHIEGWPCLDTQVQDFAMDRFYLEQYRESGVIMKSEDLVTIVSRVRSRDPHVKLPSESDNTFNDLLKRINLTILDAVHERRCEILHSNLEEYPGYDPSDAPPENKELNNETRKAYIEKLQDLIKDPDVNDATESTLDDQINLDEEGDDVAKEGDDDECDEAQECDEVIEETEEAVEKADEAMLRIKQELDDMAHEEDAMETVASSRIEGVGGNIEIDNSPNEAVAGCTVSTAISMEVKKEREEREVVEGGTSTTSPVEARDREETEERNIEKESQLSVQAMSDEGIKVMEEERRGIEGEEGQQGNHTLPAPLPKLSSNTIVLDDESEDEVEEREMNEGKVKVEAKGAVVVPPTTPQIGQTGPSPPKPIQRTPAEAWKLKAKEIQRWVNGLQSEESINQEVQVHTLDSDDDEDVEVLLDDFEMDSVSHSGLRLTRRATGAATPSAAAAAAVNRPAALPDTPPLTGPSPHEKETEGRQGGDETADDDVVEVIELD
ncbi:hypothetical protein PFISCL1PPCAC_19587 [Pristionchus fissidentatus]|uniref:Uncharacterized protein n=1 Tax=Pristionchus fissidentatus TaxID=1538716 RepID=A0AAV5WCZ1_9BILA|nr:hypothetical protein PFISCL1PPCAC_19587 [Pristionchus fissidentatus]